MKKRDYTGVLIAFVLLGVPALYCVYFVFLYRGFSDLPGQSDVLIGVRAGTFGDAFGTLNALFSGLAFAGVMMTLLLQRKDLSESQEQISKQQVESQFYSLLNLQQQVVHGFDIQRRRSTGTIIISGRDCFNEWFASMRTSSLSSRFQSLSSPERAMAGYEEMMGSHQGDLGLYFRSLYSMFKYIENSNHVDKRHLALIVRSFLSDYELVLIFYNCLSKRGEKFLRFATMYALFDNLDVQLLLDLEHVFLVPASAFGGNVNALKAVGDALSPTS
ncbi:hypothetical protein CCL15_22480 [Pseudomonas syringae]|uniref:putative phage abortive infection protein n=1 Tax=Pseudomonas syringae TaxID=317 RepID=UPI000BB5A40C|nr:putative phage abortive infection protein [Pseudomonas syringae]PBP65948.1 hypothetical protein CCL15_22480 [Pseudomonas syringae]